MISEESLRLRSWRVLTLRKKRFGHNHCHLQYLLVVYLVAQYHMFCLQADKAVQEMERKCDQKLAEHKEESQQYLMHIQQEHAVLV